MVTALVERKIRVRGSIPRLPSLESGKKITPAVDYNLVLPMFELTEPAKKPAAPPLKEPIKLKPKAQRYPYPCPDCREMSQWTNGKRIWCSQCSHK